MEQFTPQIFTSVINSYLPEPHASLLNGMLFGINLKTSKIFYEELKVVGLLHIVVLSGMNITLLGSIILNIFSFFGKSISGLITILIIIFFIIFVGAQAPIVRAGFMGVLTLVAFLYGRKNYVLFALFLSAVFIFIFQPSWLGSISFQLSYGATLGIILFGQTKDFKSQNFLEKIFLALWKNLKVSLAAQLFTAPIIFIYFKQISLIAPVSNLFVSFLIGPLTLLGFITAILGKINYSLGLIPAYICYGLLSYMIFVIETLSKLPFVYFKF
ncbi:hypothetical protein A2954_00020 [Candidatus Roizmanbacteria bacterium RIFCSPLOWO2_01_FULL_37_12]|uniref:ComEC/Rec2-related protein domain-containing protein n=1 Tax=Candidatus Roizmanbacteria bacterium RIFCSPLOWO2_01_FULL_37_12 TaxID=1802056 RepID=A0A1F7IBD9_9BACT|nr:MAG: hypothetical protein A3D76_02125 [Candidatus Roizmanbacteria bacterium RIFCSPHIGHO2_02_FULL_37_9b]OGK40669.1 MAG: hypothetical protein A2954_00020 [Candidatus Roizmanbacteria bacterium RIFCSPLOWO2_01_FULL_37_12]